MIAMPIYGEDNVNCGQSRGGDCHGAPKLHAVGIFYQAALMGEDTVISNYYDPSTESMYAVTIPNDLNVLQWETNVTLS